MDQNQVPQKEFLLLTVPTQREPTINQHLHLNLKQVYWDFFWENQIQNAWYPNFLIYQQDKTTLCNKIKGNALSELKDTQHLLNFATSNTNLSAISVVSVATSLSHATTHGIISPTQVRSWNLY